MGLCCAVSPDGDVQKRQRHQQAFSCQFGYGFFIWGCTGLQWPEGRPSSRGSHLQLNLSQSVVVQAAALTLTSGRSCSI